MKPHPAIVAASAPRFWICSRVPRIRKFFMGGMATLLAAVSLQAAPITEDFEGGSDGNAVTGTLTGWTAPAGAGNFSNLEASEGTLSLRIPSSNPVGELLRTISSPEWTASDIAWVDLWVLPVAVLSSATVPSVDLDGARIFFLREMSGAQVYVEEPDGMSGFDRYATGALFTTNGNYESNDWLHLTVRHQLAAGLWDLYVNGVLRIVGLDLGAPLARPTYLTLRGNLSYNTFYDDMWIGGTNPLFTDTDNDGMPDSYETTHGLDTGTDDRNDDEDDDGVENIREYLMGSSPSVADTDNDGLPDGYEIAHGHDPLLPDGEDDVDVNGQPDILDYLESQLPAGAVLWLRADEGITVDGSGNVSSWEDQSVEGNDAGQGTSSQRPAFDADGLQGSPTLIFDGSNDFLSAGSDSSLNFSDVSFFIVGSFGSTSQDQMTILSKDEGGGPTNKWIFWYYDGGMKFHFQPSGSSVNSSAWPRKLDKPFLLDLIKSGSGYSYFRDGEALGTPTNSNSLPTVSADLRLGQAEGNFFLNGKISEVMIYPDNLSAGDREAVELYLAEKYGTYHPDAVWIRGYDAGVQEEIHDNRWTRATADDYVTFAGLTHDVPVASLRLWLKADAGVSVDGSGNVTAWEDQGFYGNNASQSNSSYRPHLEATGIAGEPTLDFDGSNDFLTAGIDASLNLDDFTIFVVGSFGSTSQDQMSFLSKDEGGGNVNKWIYWYYGGAPSFHFYPPSTGLAGTLWKRKLDRPFLTGLTRSGSNFTYFHGGLAAGTSSSASPLPLINSDLRIGQAEGQFFYNGEISEILIYKRALNETELDEVGAYLADRYHIYHPDAAWITAFDPEVQDEIHWSQLNEDEAEAYEIYLATMPPVPVHGLNLWLKADTGVTTDGSGNLSLWEDQSFYGNDAVQGTGTAQPDVVASQINSLPVVRFDGIDDFLSLPDFLSGESEGEMFMVAKASRLYPDWNGHSHFGTYSSLRNHYPADDFQIYDDFGSNFRHETGRVILDMSQYHIYDAVSASGDWELRLNGVLQFSTSGNTVAFTTAPTLARHDSHFFSGDYAEILIYSRKLSVTERRAVENYLAGKYGLSAIPDAPAFIAASPLSPERVSVTWNYTLDATATDFELERKIASGSFAKIATLRNTTGYVDTEADASTDYTYRVRATSAAGASGYATSDTVTTPSTGGDFPTDGMRLWLRADAQSAGDMATWEDQSTNAAHAVQVTQSARPTLIQHVINGRPVVRFDGSNDYLTLPAFMSGATAGEIFMVVKASRFNPNWNGHSHFGTYSALRNHYPADDNQIYDDFGSSARYASGPVITDLARYHIYNAWSATNDWALLLNGALQYSSSSNTVAFTSSPTLGRHDSHFFEGDYAEIIVYDRKLTSDERREVEYYLASKYALSAPPFAPSIKATALSPERALIVWSHPLSNFPTEFQLERKTGTGAFEWIASMTNITSYVDTGVEAGNAYTYRVRARIGPSVSEYSVSEEIETPEAGEDLPLSGMRLWLKADAAQIPSVGVWQDDSSTASDAGQASNEARPTVITNAINGRPSVRFDGVNDYLSLPDFMSGATAGEMFMVAKASRFNPSWNGHSHFGTYNSLRNHYPADDNRIYDDFGSDQRHMSNPVTVDMSKFHIYDAISASGDWSLSLNDVVQYSTSTNTVAFTAAPTLGRHNSHFFEGDYTEILVYDRKLSNDERAAVFNYLHIKYLPSDLDADNDGLTNGQEASLGSNALNADSDGDGLDDLWESENNFDVLNPDEDSNSTLDSLDDRDLDGISNGDELLAETDPNDYYNGDYVDVEVVSGGDLTAAAGYYTEDPIVIRLKDPVSGLPLEWENAPIQMTVTGGLAGISGDDVTPAPLSSALTLLTNVDGEVEFWVRAGSLATGIITLSVEATGGEPIAVEVDTNPLGVTWRMTYFGTLDVDPEADRDGDGLSNHEEFIGETNPLDFYNGGDEPEIEKISGDNQTVNGYGFASEPLVVRVKNATTGDPIPGAGLYIGGSTGGVFLTETDDEIAYVDYALADENGYIRVYTLTGLSIGPATVSFRTYNDTSKSFTVTMTGFTAAPVLEWLMDEGTGTLVEDETANGYDGTLSGGTRAGSQFVNGDIMFDGTDDSITTTSPQTNLDFARTDFSVSFWFKAPDDSRQTRILSKGVASWAAGWFVGMGQTGPGELSFCIGGGAIGDSLAVGTSQSYDDGEWHQAVITVQWGTRTAIIYVDAIPQDLKTLTGTGGSLGYGSARFLNMPDLSASSSDELVVAYDSSSVIPAWSGTLDEVRVHDGLLKLQEVTDLYITTKDIDRDTLSAAEEALLGTSDEDIAGIDSDGDGTGDAEEVDDGTDPADPEPPSPTDPPMLQVHTPLE